MILIRTQPSLNRDFTLLSLFILFLMIIMSLWVAYETFDHQRERTTLKLQQAAERIDTALTQQIQNSSQLLDGIGQQFISAENQDRTSISRIFKSLKKYRDENQMVLSWIDNNQKLTYSSNYGRTEPPVDVSDRDYIKRAINKPWQVIINRPIKGRINKHWMIPLSLGIVDNESHFLGVILMGLNIENIKTIAKAAAGDDAINFAITNRAFTLLTGTYQQANHFKRHFDLNELSKKDFLIPQADTYATAKPWDPKTAFAYYQTASTYPFVYFLTYDRAESVANLKRILIARIFQLVAVGGFLLFVLWTVRKRIIQPVIALSSSTRAATLGSSFETVSYHGPQEIQTLNQEIYKFWLYTQERKRVETELRHKLAELIRIRESANLTNQTKSEFFNFVIDALNNSTSSILEQSETIKDQHFGDISNPRYTKNAEAIHHNAQSILQLLQKASKVSADEPGLIELDESWVDTGQLLRKSLQIFNETQLATLQLQIDNHASMPALYADKQRLRQLFFYVFAIISTKFKSNNTIRISSNIRNNHLHLFFSFTDDSATSTYNENDPATNMSLALARLIAAMHDGTVEIKTAPNKVNTLTVKLPASRIKT